MSVTAPAGFRASGVAAGIKPSGATDVALVVNDGPDDAATGVFTANRVKAAPVLWSEQVLAGGRVRAVVLNSGCANACTGPVGSAATHATAEAAGRELGVDAGTVAVCSTGKIGEVLDANRMAGGVGQAAARLRATGGDDSARAIMTTDTVPKQAMAEAGGFVVGGMAKGAGMLAPELATMLVVLTTDAAADPSALSAALREAAHTTFERVDVDGCLSTNDTVLCLASGASGVRPSYEDLVDAVGQVCDDLAGQLVADAEGASKLIHVTVSNAASEDDAVHVARAVARSNLLKCALGGGDPNWGRVLAAVGTTGAAFDPQALDAAINDVWVCRGTAPAAEPAAVDLSGRDVTVEVDLHAGSHAATIRTTDLTAGYVAINAEYST